MTRKKSEPMTDPYGTLLGAGDLLDMALSMRPWNDLATRRFLIEVVR